MKVGFHFCWKAEVTCIAYNISKFRIDMYVLLMFFEQGHWCDPLLSATFYNRKT